MSTKPAFQFGIGVYRIPVNLGTFLDKGNQNDIILLEMNIVIEIILTDKKTSAVKSKSNSNIEAIVFLYYFDRVLNALGENARSFLISEFDGIVDGIFDDFTKNPLKRQGSELGAYFLGTDFSLKSHVNGKEVFKAKGDLIKSKKGLLMQTHFSPFSIGNDKTELYVIETVHAFFHHFVGKAKPETRFIMGALLDHTFKHYENKGFSITNVGLAPSLALAAIFNLEKEKRSTWFQDVEKLFDN